jgi:tetratricopeptide (TPR) repeat protein
LKRIILANARYWLNYLVSRSGKERIPEADIRGVARALEAVMRVPEGWLLTQALAQALHPYMERRGYWADWEGFLGALVSEAERRGDVKAEAEWRARRGEIQLQRGAYRAAIISYRRALMLCRRIDDRLGRARALSNLGYVYRFAGQFRRAEVLCLGALALFESLGERGHLAYTENHLALVYFDQCYWLQALPHFGRSEALWREVGNPHGLAKTLQNLGELHRRMGNLAAALACFREAIQHYQSVGDQIHVACTRLNIGNVHLNQDELLQAEMAYSQAELILKHSGDSVNLARVHHNLGMVYTRFGNWEAALACFDRALERWRGREDMWNLANTLGELAEVHLARGDASQAAACLDEAQSLVREGDGGYYAPLKQELAARRQRLPGRSSPLLA